MDAHLETAGARWREHFDSVEALARRLVALEQGLAADMATTNMSADERYRELDREARGVPDDGGRELLRKDDLRHHRRGGRGEALLRVQGPRDDQPRPYDRHGTVLRAMRGLGQRTTQRPIPRTDGVEGFDVNASEPILVERRVVEAVVSAMLRRPFVLLAGVSGSGKTQLAKRLGKAWAAGLFHGRSRTDTTSFAPREKLSVKKVMDAFSSIDFVKAAGAHDGAEWLLVNELTESDETTLAGWRARYAFTAVKSDWTEASHLWGYHVPLPAEAEGFYATSTLRVFLRAHKAWKTLTTQNTGARAVVPHFVLLDEMNLSRPEHFGSDLLSAMEVQLGSEGASAELIELHRAGETVRLRGDEDAGDGDTVPARIGWAPGLCVIGTVNVDETTFSFAPKVLDRAALLEFTEVNLEVMFSGERYRGGKHDEVFANHKARFSALQTLLMPYNLHLAYRAAAEILDALADANDTDAEWDHQICHKVLPRIRGPRASVEQLLLDLRKDEHLCHRALREHDAITERDERRAIESGKFPVYDTEKAVSDGGYKGVWALRTVKKIDQMLMRAWTTGFTSYFG